MSPLTEYTLRARRDRRAEKPLSIAQLINVQLHLARLCREDMLRYLRGGMKGCARERHTRAIACYTAAFEMAMAIGERPQLLSRGRRGQHSRRIAA